MKQFDLDEYLANPSRKVVTREGLDVEFLCTNAPGSYPIIAIKVADKISFNCTVDGICFNDPLNDLYFAPEKHEGWINVYGGDGGFRGGSIYPSKEQKAIDEEIRLKKCDDMTEAEYNREIAFVDWYLKNGKGTPTFSDAIEWARRELIDKAVAVLVDSGVFGLKDSYGAKAFRKAMEE